MAWPKGRPRKIKEEPVPEIKPIEPKEEGRALQPAVGTKRTGGKSALMAENQEMAAREEEDKSERDKIGDKYMEENYGTPEEELSQEKEETPPASEGELSQDESEEAAPEGEQEEVQPEEETVPISQLKDTQDKMHQATSEAANYRKLFEEVSPYVDWGKFQLSAKGEGKPKIEPEIEFETPPLDLLVSDPNKWGQELAKKMWGEFEKKALPQITSHTTAHTEWTRCQREFDKEMKDVPGGAKRWLPVLQGYMEELREPVEKRSLTELYEAAREKFNQDFGHVLNVKKQTKKVVPLESPGKAKERTPAKPEKEMTMQEWENEARDYVKFRQKKLRELQDL